MARWEGSAGALPFRAVHAGNHESRRPTPAIHPSQAPIAVPTQGSNTDPMMPPATAPIHGRVSSFFVGAGGGAGGGKTVGREAGGRGEAPLHVELVEEDGEDEAGGDGWPLPKPARTWALVGFAGNFCGDGVVDRGGVVDWRGLLSWSRMEVLETPTGETGCVVVVLPPSAVRSTKRAASSGSSS